MTGIARPLVSIIIPAYNSGSRIAETIGSCLEQTYPELEVIVVDDGSKDDTAAIAGRFMHDSRVRVITRENSGACAARNHGIRLSKGKYLQFLDADDLLSPDKIESQVDALEKEPGTMAMCTTVHFFDGQDPYQQPLPDESFFLYDTGDPASFLTRLWGGDGKTSMVQTSAWLTPRDITDRCGPWDETILLDQDGEYFARAVLLSKGLRFTKGVNYYRKYIYGRNVAGQSFKRKNLESALYALEKKSSYLLEKKDDARVRKAIATQLFDIAINTWPQYPGLTREILKKVKAQGQKPRMPVLGGKEIEWIKKVFGWKVAKYISYHFHKKLIHRKK